MIYHDTLICYNIWPLFADHCLDFPKEYYIANGVERLHNVDVFVPDDVKENDIVFVKTDFIVSGEFYKTYFPFIKNKFKLITGNSSYQIGAVGDDSYKFILESEKLLKWFCTNPPEIDNDKIVPIPIGFEEPNRECGNQMILNKIRNKRKYFWDRIETNVFLPYHNFSTNPGRKKIYDNLSSLEFVNRQETKQSMVDYLSSINNHRFVICIEGSGNDLHRIYETLLVGSIPIVSDSSLKKMFEFYDLPCVMVKDWSELKRYMLEPYIAFSSNIDDKFKSVETFLYANNYRDLFSKGIWNENRSINR